MFQFPAFAPHSWWHPFRVPGSPIRTPPDLRPFAPPRSFSQLVTSFFASESLGIPRALLLDFLVSSFNCKSISRRPDKHGTPSLTFDSSFGRADARPLFVSPMCLLIQKCQIPLPGPGPGRRNGRGTNRARPMGRTFSRDSARRAAATIMSLFVFAPSFGRPLERRCSSRTFRYGYLVTT